MHTQFAIYSDNLDIDYITIMELFNRCSSMGDVVVITDSIDSSRFNQCPLFPSFYLRFFQGSVIFIHIEDYIEYKDNMMGSPMLFIDEDTINSNNKHLIKQQHIISKESLL